MNTLIYERIESHKKKSLETGELLLYTEKFFGSESFDGSVFKIYTSVPITQGDTNLL